MPAEAMATPPFTRTDGDAPAYGRFPAPATS